MTDSTKQKGLEWQKQGLSDNERLKAESNFLRGTILDDLEDGLTGGFKGDNFQMIRFHGMYEQDDRDIRAERADEKLEARKFMLLRCRLPGGIIKPAQWIEIDKFARDNNYYQSIRLTNRQTFQYHGVPKTKLQEMHRLLHKLGLDSIATASDMNRNVLCSSNPVESELHQEAYEWAKKISEHLLPRTNGYLDVWIAGKKVQSSDSFLGQEDEPILGKTYLPRKYKTAVVLPPLNDVDMYGNDMNFVGIQDEAGKLVGFNVLVGGGLSFEHGNTKTYPNVALELGYIPVEQTLKAAECIVTTQRDFGNRADRKNARLRYTLQNMTLDGFREEVERRMGFKFESIRPFEFTERGDRIGWVKGIDDKWHLTCFIESGRITDKPGKPLMTGMLELAKVHTGDFRITANQNIIIANVAEEDKQRIEDIAREYGLIGNISKLRENSMSCVSFPTCPLAMAESERALPEFIDELDNIMAKHDVADDYIVTRITGCPNGCGRAMLAEIGLVGKAIGRYNLHLGGDRPGTRIPRMYKENITLPEILAELDGLIGRWAKERNSNEGFGDFVIRAGIIKPVVNAVVDFWDANLIPTVTA
ncbi:assimilatory sulfite reductase (NADPH) hemoprotein subunit [Actinobacillus succinogenes]|uniref:Sulfite reductase [NADPH] hemoprotein beta-component n=1 Tax=Actinobacillus succinogenes (strain ATCC 55618 / DSM 22257 / CCUG 43843 / 130Z) TaxID=339671 RepID=CYSI_ACTSZ|nr:assimilatory sulfite reductase (NADPH) hemoprotein subunit [Actinobacillus succinogenes]A6VPZ1.1 RecName: Full=Sulfite reductase [NADPH] hemoprotein beta-component; Short=SiR-HP; Short=SiRHP [Actinobacillus succinogenes 130Z]ABR75038.1 sulfite reductase (NADPH) hemoprotein, beta-component [Actinobacillus succinogenes 130Z]PHI40555.1 assimilatory sulfite reductase (NADPH) hemoprotein subunit [Actinobacillus succinogenes]